MLLLVSTMNAILTPSRGLFSNVIHDTAVTCAPLEINIFQPPAGQTCGQFAGPFVSFGIGALYNPNATKNCEYCRFSTGDQYLKTLDMNWSHRWRNFGFLWVYVLFNIGMMCFVTWLPRQLRRRAARRVGKAAGKGLGAQQEPPEVTREKQAK
jgi:ABC-type multidrug transport system permease subunit